MAAQFPVYQTKQIRQIEEIAKERFLISPQVLMQRAGDAAFKLLLQRWPHAKHIAVFCGSGNNGGDGLVLALLAHNHGLKVTIWQVGSWDKVKEPAKSCYGLCSQLRVPMHQFEEGIHLQGIDVIVDAICGIGLKETPRDHFLSAIQLIKKTGLPVYALDVPTGVNADTGFVPGEAVRATVTITFIGLKIGLLTGNGAAYVGELVKNDLQLPPELFSEIEPSAELITPSPFMQYLQPRPRDWHKGLSGHVLIIGGELGFSGAPRMAAEAALRVGAGLVTVATRPESALTMNIECPEIMCHGIKQPEELLPLLEKADVIVVGPGLGQTEWAQALCENAFRSDQPRVIDADALNILAASKKLKLKGPTVITPHPGEAARLLGTTSSHIQQDRFKALLELYERYSGVVVLKGAGTLVYAAGSYTGLCDKGNPGMASAGLGDVLSGVIAGLIAQKIPAADAAKLGVYIHAMAGDLAAAEAGERGLVAMDLMPYLRQLVNPHEKV